MLADGRLSRAPHPEALRSPRYTRDFAETQLEIVTAPAPSIPALMAELATLTRRARAVVAPEVLWPFSMPPELPGEADIAVAALGRRATLYREGLALRHGKARQMICGVHLNVSFGPRMLDWLRGAAPLASGEEAFLLRLTRNLYEALPSFMLLFGAAPVRADSEALAISHRNGPAGYAGADFRPYLDLSSCAAHLAGIRKGLRTRSAAFMALGLVRDGRALQLNGNVFQTEKECYAPIRMRRPAPPGGSELRALAQRGPEYLELRFFDLDPVEPSGLSEAAVRLMHLFLLDALIRPTRPRGPAELGQDLDRAAEAAGLDPLQAVGDARFARLRERLDSLEGWARRLDALEPGDPYLGALSAYRDKAADPLRLPSAALARALQASGASWTAFGMRTALAPLT